MITKISNEVIAELAASSSYKERFIAEYILLKQKYEKLRVFNTKIEAAGEMAFRASSNTVPMPKHDCPEELLRRQQHVMGEYLHILEVRAVIEGIDLKETVEALARESICRASENCSGEEAKCCCQSEKTPPCEEEIRETSESLPDGVMGLERTIAMLESAIHCETSGEDCKEAACPMYGARLDGTKCCLWGEPESYKSSLYHLKKYAGLE